MKSTFKYPLVRIVWDDAESDAAWSEEPTSPMKPTLVMTIGFLIKQEENYVLVADSYFLEAHSKTVGNTNKIPMGMIQEMIPLTISTPRKKKGTENVT